MDELTEPENGEQNLPPEPPPDKILCRNCGTPNNLKARFCTGCGQPLREKHSEKITVKRDRAIVSTLFFFFALVLMLLIYRFTSVFEPNFKSELFISILLSGVTVIFAFLNFDEIKKLYSLRNVRASKTLYYMLCMMVAAVAVTWLASKINGLMGQGIDVSYTSIYDETPFPVLFAFLFVAVQPAVFEEMAFRGFLFNHILKFVSPRATIIVTAVLFAFVHFAFISLLWHIPLGLFFGYVRFRYRNLWYSTICHFTYNGTIVLLELMNIG